MIVLPLLVATAIGFLIRPTHRALCVVAALIVALGTLLWFAVAHNDGETLTFLASIAGLGAVSAGCTIGGAAMAARRKEHEPNHVDTK